MTKLYALKFVRKQWRASADHRKDGRKAMRDDLREQKLCHDSSKRTCKKTKTKRETIRKKCEKRYRKLEH